MGSPFRRGRFYFSRRSGGRKIETSLIVCGLLFWSSAAPGAWAQDLLFSAKVDKTTVNVGDSINLTLSLSGDLSGIEVPAFQFPEGFVTLARSQSTNVAFRAGAMERSMNLTYVLVPQQAGTFQFGPFQVQQGKTVFKTSPISITVKKSALPPNLPPTRERFTL